MSENTLYHPLKDLCIRISKFAKLHCGNYDLLDCDYDFFKDLEKMALDYLSYHYIGEEDFESFNTFYDIYDEQCEEIYDSDCPNNSERDRDENFDEYGKSNNYFHESQSDSLDYDDENFDLKWNKAKDFSANWRKFDSYSDNPCPDEQYDRVDQTDQTDHDDTDNFDCSNSYSEGEDFDYQEYNVDYQDQLLKVVKYVSTISIIIP